MSKHYRQIWIDANGPIPKDNDGRAYEIHHINGDHADNRLENLTCMTIQEHYAAHIERGDWAAAMMIARRMGKTPEELSAIQSGGKHPASTRMKIAKTRSESRKPAWNKGKSGYTINANRAGNRYSSKITAVDVIFMRDLLQRESVPVKHRRKDSTYLSSLAWWLQENHYPQLTLVAIRDILQSKSWKEVQFIKNTEYEILTPSGYQDFSGVRTHQVQGLVKITLCDDRVLRCTRDHRIETQRGFVEAGMLTYNDFVITDIYGKATIKYLDTETVAEIVYDPVEVAGGNVYLSTGIVSHNCEFISSQAMLVDSLKLSFLRPSNPVSENMGFKFWTDNIGGRGKTYLVGLDPATGNGKDWTVVEVFEFPKMVQVAELRVNTVNIPLIYAKLKWLFKLLRKPDAGKGRSEIIWSFERNGVGEALVALIQNDDSPDGGIYLDGVDLYNENPLRLGCYTTGKSKMLSCMQLKNLIEKGPTGIKINSAHLLYELQNFVAAGGTFQASAALARTERPAPLPWPPSSPSP